MLAAPESQQQATQPQNAGMTSPASAAESKPVPDLVPEDGFAGGWKPELEPKGDYSDGECDTLLETLLWEGWLVVWW